MSGGCEETRDHVEWTTPFEEIKGTPETQGYLALLEKTVVRGGRGVWGTRARTADEEPLDPRENLENLDREASMENLEPQDLRGPDKSRVHKVLRGFLVYLDLREDQDDLELQRRKGDKDPTDRRASLETQETRVALDLRAPEGPRGWMAEMGMEPRDLKESRATEASMDIQVSWEKMDPKGLTGLKDTKGSVAQMETRVLLEVREMMERSETPDTRVPEVLLENARTCASWCSTSETTASAATTVWSARWSPRSW